MSILGSKLVARNQSDMKVRCWTYQSYCRHYRKTKMMWFCWICGILRSGRFSKDRWAMLAAGERINLFLFTWEGMMFDIACPRGSLKLCCVCCGRAGGNGRHSLFQVRSGPPPPPPPFLLLIYIYSSSPLLGVRSVAISFSRSGAP